MANATATFTLKAFPNGIENTLDHVHLFGTVAISASPGTYPANGLPLTFVGPNVYTGIAPFLVWFSGLSGYDYNYDAAHGTIRAYLGGTEIAANAAIPAAVSGDTIVAEALTTRV